MKDRITLTALKVLPCTSKGQKRVFLWDTEVKKFGAYRTSTGDVVFVYQFRMHARQPVERLTIGKLGSLTPDQARTIAASAALKVASGINPIAERRAAFAKESVDESLIVRNFVQHYLTTQIDAKRRRSAVQIRRELEVDVCAHLGDQLISEITVPMVEKMLATLSLRGPGVARSALVQLKAMLNYAKRTHRIDKVTIEMMIPEPSPERDRELKIRELRRLLEAAHDLGDPRGDAYQCIVRLLKRRSEVSRMEWKEIDQDQWVWRLPGERSKNEKPQEIILPPAVIAIIQRQQPDPQLRQGFVFTLKGVAAASLGTKMRHALDARIHRRIELAAAAGRPMPAVEYFVIHDIRTTIASLMQDLEPPIPPHIIEAALHHEGGKTKIQRKYQRKQYAAQVGRALVQLEEAIDNIMADEDAWPGGRELPPMTKKEADARTAAFRAGWPKRGCKNGRASKPG